MATSYSGVHFSIQLPVCDFKGYTFLNVTGIASFRPANRSKLGMAIFLGHQLHPRALLFLGWNVDDGDVW